MTNRATGCYKNLVIFFLILFFLISVTEAIAASESPKERKTIPYYSKFPITNIDVSPNNKKISNISEAVDYLNHSLKHRLNFSNKEIFNISGTDQLESGYKVYRFQHFYQGIPVEFNDFILSVNQDAEAHRIWGYARPIDDVNIEASLTKEVATEQALNNRYPNLKLNTIKTLENYGLVIWLEDYKSGHLAYKSDLQFEYEDGIIMLRIYADADTGELLGTLPLVYHALNRMILYNPPPTCVKHVASVHEFQICEGTRVPSFQNVQVRCEGQPPASIHHIDNLYNSLGKIYGYLKDYHGYDSFDNEGHPLIATVFSTRRLPCEEDAFYHLGQKTFGFSFRFANALEVVGHEIMHGVIGNYRLMYEREPGALNESYADIFGVTAKFWLKSNSFDGQPSASDYLIEDVRDMSDPWAKGQPDFYPEALYLDDPECTRRLPPYGNDHCGVHINAGINNLAFYLLAEGGQHPRQKTSIQVPGIGMEKALKIYFEGLKNFNYRTGFVQARRHLVEEAQRLYGAEVSRSVNLAFDAVGVPVSASSPDDAFDSVPLTLKHGNLLLVLLGLVLLFFVLSIRKSKKVTRKGGSSTKNPSQTVKTWMLSDHNTNQFVLLSASKLMLPDGVVIGRSPQFCHRVLADKYLSSRHARFSMQDDTLYVEDLNTTNGTYVNGVKIKPFKRIALDVGNKIKLARYSFFVRYGTAK